MSSVDFRHLKEQLTRAAGGLDNRDVDYQIVVSVGHAFLARSRTGAPALLIPLDSAPTGAGRSGGGFSLRAIDRLAFSLEGRKWQQAAATFESTEPSSVDAFLVLVQDLLNRLGAVKLVDWATVLLWLEEWQALLSRGSSMSVERQLGLWGELWLISKASDPAALIRAWCGPDRQPTDFFFDGAALEIKVSRRPLTHYMSQRQAVRPVGEHRAYLLSMWVGSDPAAGVSLAELVDEVLAIAADPPTVLRRIMSVGYSPSERDQYMTRFALLESPQCFRSEDLPRVHMIDPGITDVRYLATLDPDKALVGAEVDDVFRRFSQVASNFTLSKVVTE